ncbi:pilus assembly protein [Phyllobacterium leguminum]|uniref:Flp pilus assembly protein TadG n=1 Tax=Phyllobacterium leguminum TaxID=314237 RepID=A0A318T9S8_9HYPH|nr:pilus assembly protein [Phyllobacterium leguminum]PYE90407.1 Flp pilus assembly protein TadG [Phyllobacterium leguminum]
MKAGHSSDIARVVAGFRHDESGNFAIMAAIIVAPLLLAGMAAIDTTNLMRTRTNVQQALDAAALAVGRQYGGGASEAVMREYGQKYFAANLKALDPARVQFNIVPPVAADPKKKVSATADFTYNSVFGTLARSLTGEDWKFNYHMVSDVRVKNTVEVALVLDNSGSMTQNGTGSGEDRIVLLRRAATQLVNSMATQAALMTQIDKPVQFSIVPFAGSVNVGNQHDDAAWMDTEGRSSIHYENFDVSEEITISPNKRLKFSDDQLKRDGTGWPVEERGKPYTRFNLYDELKISNGRTPKPFANWLGCVETRPGGYNLDDTAPDAAVPDTLFVPMFAPDEDNYSQNSWWTDGNADVKHRDIRKYFLHATANTRPLVNVYDKGPNYSCTTNPITPLTDVSPADGLSKIIDAIDEMDPISTATTNVPEGMAWGWRTISHGEPFTEGRSETQRGNDKVVIVLTDGANTYSSNKYAAFGYPRQITKPSTIPRIFQNTSIVVPTVHTNDNYTAAMNEQFATLCNNVKTAKVIVMTIALDLNESDDEERQQIEALKACASDSRTRSDPDDAGKPAKLFWNTKGENLAETFRQIGDELSNLRIVR